MEVSWEIDFKTCLGLATANFQVGNYEKRTSVAAPSHIRDCEQRRCDWKSYSDKTILCDGLQGTRSNPSRPGLWRGERSSQNLPRRSKFLWHCARPLDVNQTRAISKPR